MKKFIALFASVALSSCTSSDNPSTFQNEPLISGADATTVVRTIDEPRYPSVMLMEENGAVGIGVFQLGTGSPVLTVRDDDNNGVFDLLTYSSVTESGEVLVEVDDYGMDGQPDFILNYHESSAKVYFEGEWLTVEGIGSSNATVMIGGQSVRLGDVLDEIGRPKYD